MGREGGERGKAGSDEEGLFLPSVHPSKACLIHSHHAHTSPWKPAAPVCDIGPLLYLHTFPHPQPCFPSSSSSPCSPRLWKNRNTESMRCCPAITWHLKHVSNMHGEMRTHQRTYPQTDNEIGSLGCEHTTVPHNHLHCRSGHSAGIGPCVSAFLMCTKGASEGC